MELLEIKNLSFTYALSTRPALRDISLTVGRGESVLLCGPTGCGKSTLLRCAKKELSPVGAYTGEVCFDGVAVSALQGLRSAAEIGFVAQDPEGQIVTDKVWHELAFALENLGYPRDKIAQRVAETAHFFGIEHLYEKKVSELSGGEKQLLSLASVMVTDPRLLILDEPTSRLDPIAAEAFVSAIRKIRDERGTAILTAEHRPGAFLQICDRALLMDGGQIAFSGEPRRLAAYICAQERQPVRVSAACSLYAAAGMKGECPLSVREGRAYLREHFSNKISSAPASRGETAPAFGGETATAKEKKTAPASGEPALTFRDVSFRYSRSGQDVLSSFDLTVNKGEIFCLLGGNGSGKTTALDAAAALIKPYAGTVRVFGKKLSEYKNGSLYRNTLSYLPQDPQTLFQYDTVEKELEKAQKEGVRIPYDFAPYAAAHPYDLSGGEQQLLALCKVLASKPRLLLADEPTKGLDDEVKDRLLQIFWDLKKDGVTVVIVTHDTDFAARAADRCGLLFGGRIAALGDPVSFFSGNRFYTTETARISDGYYEGAVTEEQLFALCRLNGPKEGDIHE